MRGKKLNDNGLWESSRIILPEHREAIVQHRRNARKRPRPELDDQRLEELQAAINEAIATRQPVSVRAWGVYEDEVHVGIIDRVDMSIGRLKLASDGEAVWIPLGDISSIEKP